VNTTSRLLKSASLLAIVACTALPAIAQSASTVVYSSPTDVVVKRASDGQLINYTIPAGTALSVGGKKVPAADVKPGTKLDAAVTGDAKVVTGVTVETGKVYQVSPPDKVTLSVTSGVSELVVPAGTTFMVDGKALTIGQLAKGMSLQATIVATTAGSDATGNTPPASTPAQAGTILLNVAAGADDLPAAGTNLPLYGVIGFGLLMLGFVLRTNRFARNKA
jgi:hypothetical protein